LPRDILSDGLRFALVGLSATAIHLGVALLALSFGAPPFAANVVGFLVALVASVLGHHHFSFPGRVSFFYGASRFIPAALVAFLVNNLVLTALGAAENPLPAWLRLTISIGVMPIISFLYSRFYAYRPRRD